MASITVRNLDAALEERLELRAAAHGRSMEEEALDILRLALAEAPDAVADLAVAVRARFAPLGGVELGLAERDPTRPSVE